MAKKVKSKWVTIPFPIFRRGVMVFVGPQEDLIATLKEKYINYGEDVENTINKHPDLVKTSLGVTFKCEEDAIVWFPEKVTLGSLVHELTHATIHILDKVDIELTPDTEEIFCYMLEYLIEQTFDWAINKK